MRDILTSRRADPGIVDVFLPTCGYGPCTPEGLAGDRLYLGDGQGGFALYPAVGIQHGLKPSRSAAVGDFNLDGRAPPPAL